MKWKQTLAVACAGISIAVSSCDAPADEPHSKQPKSNAVPAVRPALANTGNRYSDQLVNMSEAERRSVFSQLMTRSGERCSTVTRTFYQGIEKERKSAFWNIDCGGADWTISIDEDSSTRLLECSIVRRLGVTKCWLKFEDQ